MWILLKELAWIHFSVQIQDTRIRIRLDPKMRDLVTPIYQQYLAVIFKSLDQIMLMASAS